MNTSKMLAEKALTEGKDVLANSESALGELIQKIGENIKLGEVSVLDGENIGSYNHNGQYGALISLKSKMMTWQKISQCTQQQCASFSKRKRHS